ncbi:hypothetical protein HDU93_006955 [Gonapodya sp. JEL0774]|nr:hypothetical protein HDU93_006955 [Gonapodya sp. JEL0774]
MDVGKHENDATGTRPVAGAMKRGFHVSRVRGSSITLPEASLRHVNILSLVASEREIRRPGPRKGWLESLYSRVLRIDGMRAQLDKSAFAESFLGDKTTYELVEAALRRIESYFEVLVASSSEAGYRHTSITAPASTPATVPRLGRPSSSSDESSDEDFPHYLAPPAVPIAPPRISEAADINVKQYMEVFNTPSMELPLEQYAMSLQAQNDSPAMPFGGVFEVASPVSSDSSSSSSSDGNTNRGSSSAAADAIANSPGTLTVSPIALHLDEHASIGPVPSVDVANLFLIRSFAYLLTHRTLYPTSPSFRPSSFAQPNPFLSHGLMCLGAMVSLYPHMNRLSAEFTGLSSQPIVQTKSGSLQKLLTQGNQPHTQDLSKLFIWTTAAAAIITREECQRFGDFILYRSLRMLRCILDAPPATRRLDTVESVLFLARYANLTAPDAVLPLISVAVKMAREQGLFKETSPYVFAGSSERDRVEEEEARRRTGWSAIMDMPAVWISSIAFANAVNNAKQIAELLRLEDSIIHHCSCLEMTAVYWAAIVHAARALTGAFSEGALQDLNTHIEHLEFIADFWVRVPVYLRDLKHLRASVLWKTSGISVNS